MTRIDVTHTSSSAAPSAFFDRWADMAGWPQWNTDTEWVRLQGPSVAGATGRLKPEGGFAVRGVVGRLVPGRELVDTSTLPGARLRFAHLVGERPAGAARSTPEVTVTGPLGWLWGRVLGGGLRASAQGDLHQLATLAEASG
jgi:hypothetical protein